MNKVVTSREEILEVSRELILKKGVSAFSMRMVAGACGVAVGSVYNYFPSKAELLGATIESVWAEIFKPFFSGAEFDSILDCVSCMFDLIKEGDKKYPAFFTVHSLNFTSDEKHMGKERMHHYFAFLEAKLVYALKQDERIKKGVFCQAFSREIFANYIFTLLVSILLNGEPDCQALLKMIENCVYDTTKNMAYQEEIRCRQ